MRHLDHDYELARPATGFIPHFHDTIDALGGWVGVCCIGLAAVAFYFIVLYVIVTGRAKREAAKAARKRK